MVCVTWFLPLVIEFFFYFLSNGIFYTTAVSQSSQKGSGKNIEWVMAEHDWKIFFLSIFSILYYNYQIHFATVGQGSHIQDSRQHITI